MKKSKDPKRSRSARIETESGRMSSQSKEAVQRKDNNGRLEEAISKETEPLSPKQGSSSSRQSVQKPLELTGKVAPVKKELRERFSEANKLIQDQILNADDPRESIDVIEPFKLSKLLLGDYVTLDWLHYEEILKLMSVIRQYAQDRTRPRPLNVIMQAEPGSGKSHFIKCLAGKMSQDGIKEVTFNMSSLQGVDDFIPPLESVRNLKVADKIPLLFLDEFDSTKENYSLLLPLLWDGELSVGQRQLRIGKVVIVLAGSGSEIADVMKVSKGMQSAPVTDHGKLSDLLSRINGSEMRIPGLDEVAGTRDRRVDKVCLTIALLSQRFGSNLTTVPWALLKFVANTRFRYGVRSISSLIELIPPRDETKSALEIKDLQLPLNNVTLLKDSSLAYHLISEDGPAAIIERWKNLKSNESQVKFQTSGDLFSQIFRFLSGGTPG